MEVSIESAGETATVILRRVVSNTKREGEKTVSHFKDGSSVFVSNLLGALIRPGDEISFPMANDSAGAGTEIYIRKTSSSGPSRDLYKAPISRAAMPKADKGDRLYVRAEVSKGGLGNSSIHLPCEVIRDHFYVSSRHRPWERQTSLYDALRITSTASLAELRVALDLDERDHMEFLYPSDPDFAEELDQRDAEAKTTLETLRGIEGTLRDLDPGKIKMQ
jgi:hypothetical protein